MRRFVDRAHGAGLAVILDVVAGGPDPDVCAAVCENLGSDRQSARGHGSCEAQSICH